ncbi:MAG: outer membrane protein assembly factor BamD [Planctomycetes bacterium]|nr:outer membrane protein assembly factor BamD [Planctomycetota bacterium]
MKFVIKILLFLTIAGCSGSDTPEEENILPQEELIKLIGSSKRDEDWESVYKYCKSFIKHYSSSPKIDEFKKIQYDACKTHVQNGDKRSFLFIPYTARTSAIDNFTDTIQSYPYEPYSAEYIMWFGDFLIELGETIPAEVQFQKIIERYKESNSVDLALYKLGTIYFNRFKGIEYAVDSLKDSELYYNRVLQEFSNSSLVESAKKKIMIIRDLLSQKLLKTAKYYEGKENIKGAVAYYNEIINKYPETSASEQSKQILAKLQSQEEKK